MSASASDTPNPDPQTQSHPRRATIHRERREAVCGAASLGGDCGASLMATWHGTGMDTWDSRRPGPEAAQFSSEHVSPSNQSRRGATSCSSCPKRSGDCPRPGCAGELDSRVSGPGHGWEEEATAGIFWNPGQGEGTLPGPRKQLQQAAWLFCDCDGHGGIPRESLLTGLAFPYSCKTSPFWQLGAWAERRAPCPSPRLL